MSQNFVRAFVRAVISVLLAIAGPFLAAQNAKITRITEPTDDRVRVTLPGTVQPLAQPRFDEGAVDDSFSVQRMFVMLQRPPESETALRQFLADAHRPGSASYHKWLTPDQFGQKYGSQDAEVEAVRGWLQSHGLAVARLTKGKTALEFSGTAKQLHDAFHIEVHTYRVNGEVRHAANRDPEIPAALAPVIAGITPINDFRPRSNLQLLGKARYDLKTHAVTPDWTLYQGVNALAPGDFAVQYDLNPLYSAGVTGTGVTIGIIGASDVDPVVVGNYKALFGLPSGNFNTVFDGDGTNPNEGNWATGESYLDVEVSGAVAPGATVTLYTAADTSVQQGLLLAALRAVEDDQAAVLSLSYGECEAALTSAGNGFWSALWEQAAAQGQTVFVSSGDNGSAGCDNFDLPQPAQYGLAVNGLASSPWNIAVGGTDFYYSSYNQSSTAQQTQLNTYWSAATTLPETSLQQPVPEQPWNRAFGLNLYDGGVYDPSTFRPTIVGGSGGASELYSKPAWQNGNGVPADQKRDLPDVSLFAASGENDSFYPVCWGTDECVPESGFLLVNAVGGTSASSPAMAGIMALINQKYGRQGQANFILYPLAAQHPEVFHDVALGSNNVPCQQGSSGCSLSSRNDNSKGFYTLGQYYANAGYDRATGLGSVDANLLVENWNSIIFTPSVTTLTASQTSFTHGTAINLNVAVSGSGGTPSGDIGLLTSATPASNTTLGEVTLKNGAASTTLSNLPGGHYQLTANYEGDTKFAPSQSNSISMSVAPESTNVALSANYWTNSGDVFAALSNGGSYPYGTYIAMDAQPKGVNAPQGSSDGLATGSVTFSDNGSSSSGAIGINRLGISEWVPSTVFAVGAHSLKADYSGDPSFNPATSAPLTFTISKVSPGAFLDARPSPVALGSVTTLDFTVGAVYASPLPAPPNSTYASSSPIAPSGSVTFSMGSIVLGTVALNPNYNGFYQSQAQLAVSSLPMGSDTVTATYGGDANYQSTTATFKVVVEQAPTLAASATPASINQAEVTAITAVVAGAQGSPVPTGTITFAAPAGSYHNWSDTETLNNGTVTSIGLPAAPYPLGAVAVDVSYSGDSTYGPADINTSFTVTQGTTLPFSLSGTPVTIATPGATANNTSSISVTPAGGFTGTVYLSCALTSSPSGAIHLPTCLITPSVNVTGADPVASVMTISTTAASTTAHAGHASSDRGHGLGGGLFAASFLALGMLVLGRGARQRVAGSLLLLSIGILLGCGGGGGGSSISPPPVPGTTAGTYVFTVGGAFSSGGPNQNSATVTVTVN